MTSSRCSERCKQSPEFYSRYGPYEIPRYLPFEKKDLKDAWASIDDDVGAELSWAQGAYIFSLRNGRNYKPLYVGITKHQGFRAEVFNPTNKVKILRDWADMKGTLILHLLAKPKGVHNGFSVGISEEWLRSLEVLLIFMCRRKNSKLSNKMHTKLLDGIGIDGITNTTKKLGKPRGAVATLRNALWW